MRKVCNRTHVVAGIASCVKFATEPSVELRTSLNWWCVFFLVNTIFYYRGLSRNSTTHGVANDKSPLRLLIPVTNFEPLTSSYQSKKKAKWKDNPAQLLYQSPKSSNATSSYTKTSASRKSSDWAWALVVEGIDYVWKLMWLTVLYSRARLS